MRLASVCIIPDANKILVRLVLTIVWTKHSVVRADLRVRRILSHMARTKVCFVCTKVEKTANISTLTSIFLKLKL
jgi:hypothetical protein